MYIMYTQYIPSIVPACVTTALLFHLEIFWLDVLGPSKCVVFARNMDEMEIDEQPVPPFVRVPRSISGPVRPGYVPYRLFAIMEMISRVTQHKDRMYIL